MNIKPHPNRGTSNPVFSVPEPFDAMPTTQGSDAPPKFERTNITAATRGAPDPNSSERTEMVIGYTEESPRPVAQALSMTPASPCEASRPAAPAQARSNPAFTNRTGVSDSRRNGASHLPSMSEA